MLEGISERSLWRKTALGSGWFTLLLRGSKRSRDDLAAI